MSKVEVDKYHAPTAQAECDCKVAATVDFPSCGSALVTRMLCGRSRGVMASSRFARSWRTASADADSGSARITTFCATEPP